ncbi:uncharacterized protein [Magallana gigas]|uniref:uncharacterized protein n=1 Tax=Magallana gigas TaxID=29159 RepID=UPI00334263AF
MRGLLYIAEDMADTGMSTRGRKRVLTDSVRKRNRQNIQASYNKARVNIGVQFERWKGLKDTLKLESHGDVAKVLLDKYELYRKDCFGSPKGSTVEPMSPAGAPITSTPGPSSFPYKCDVSRITSSEAEITDCRCPIVKESNSFINPFDLTIDVTEVEMTDDDVEDDDYEPSFNITLREGLDTTAATDDDEDDECISDEEIETTEVDFSQSSGCHRIKTNEEIQGFMNDQPFLIYYNQLLNLATANIQKTCSHKGCGLGVEIKKEVVASALYYFELIIQKLVVDHLFIVLNRNSLSNILSYLRYQRVFQKKSSRWSVTTCKEPKQYSYVPEMMRKIILKRLDDAIGMNQKMVIEQDDPRRVSSHLAPIPPPPTQQIVHEQRSRFRTSVDMDKTIDYWVE